MYNKLHIVEELDGLIKTLASYREAIQAEDEDRLREELKNGRLIRESIKRGND